VSGPSCPYASIHRHRHNGEKIAGATPVNWDTELAAIAATIDWKGGDLFPHFDMPALGV
jgi:hypothetical protein